MCWQELRKSQGGCLILEKPGSRPDTRQMTVVTFSIDTEDLAEEMLAHIDRMVLDGRLDLKVATRLMADRLGMLITLQVNAGHEDIAAVVDEACRQAGIGPVTDMEGD